MTTTLNKIVLTIIGICLYSFYFSQTPGEWTWMAGSNSNGDPVYGIQGVPDPANTPEDFYEAAKWTDNQGNFWVYGGLGKQNLWKFDVSTNMWTWIHGPGIISPNLPSFGPPNVYSPTVLPGSTGLAEHAEWVDTNGNLWLFCNSPSILGVLPPGTMWKYDISLNQWAFVHGNIPINSGVMGVPDPMNNIYAYESPVSWVGDDGGLWMLSGFEGKIYKFDIASSMWTWMHGTPSPTNIIGTVGQYDPNNNPAVGACYQHWKSDDGTFYIFGPVSQFPNNTMWQFNPLINQWRFVHAGNLSSTAVFSSSGFDLLNCPSNTFEQRSCWKDECNRFYGIDQHSGGYIYCFDPAINQYALVEGSPSAPDIYLPPNFGTIGVSSPTVFPGSFIDEGAASWSDNSGNFWKLGSRYFDTILGGIKHYSSLWRYVPDLTEIGGVSAVFNANPQQGCIPLEVDFLPQDTSSTLTFQWNFGDPSTLSDTSSSPTPAYSYNSPGVYTVELIVSGNSYCGTETDTSEIIVTVLDTPIANLSTSTISGCSPLDITFKNLSSNATSYQWDLGAGFIVVADTSSQFGTYTAPDTIYLIATNGFCDDTTSISIDCGVCGCTNPLAINYNPLAIIDDGSCIMPTPIIVAPNVFTPNSDAENNTFFIKTTFAKNTELTILNRWGNVVFEGSGIQPEWDGKNAVEGVYFYKYKVTGVLDDVYEGHGYVEMVK